MAIAPEEIEGTENDAIIEEMMTAEMAPEPGADMDGEYRREVIHRGDEEAPSPIVTTALQSAGYAYIYDRRTGDRSVTNRNMLPAQLKKRRPDGSRVFSVHPPRDAKGKIIRPRQGTIKCLLHADLRADHPEYDEMALPTCDKASLKSDYQRTIHMKRRHKEEWAAIESLRTEAKERAERAFQEAVMTAVGSAAAVRGKRGKGDES